MEQKEIKTINDIDYENNPEGRLLFSALTILTATEYQDKTPDEVIKIVSAHADNFLEKFQGENLNVEDNLEEVKDL